MTKDEVLSELKTKGSKTIRKIFKNHGAPDSLYGVKIEDLKVIQKKIKKDHSLAMELYKTGISDAMYLAGLIGDGNQMTKEELDDWARNATWSMHSDYTVPWVACENKDGVEIGMKWIDSPEEKIACAGWATLSCVAGVISDEKLDINLYSSLLDRVKKEIHNASDRVRYNMNGFVIAIGCYIPALTEKSKKIALEIGKVKVNMGNTACKVPDAAEYIKKVELKGKIGKKRKEARC